MLSPYDTAVSFVGWRTNPNFIAAILVSLDLPPELLGDYHLGADTTPALGAASKDVPPYQGSGTLNAPAFDIDHQGRPSPSGFDAGADEFPGGVTAPPTAADALYFSTFGNTNPPAVAGTADDADIYYWDGAAFSRSIDVTAITNPLPTGANVDGLVRVDATHFYMSFSGQVAVPGIGNVQDEDVVYYNAGTWSYFFDGSLYGLGSTAALTDVDLDAISIVGGTLYFSTDTAIVPPGAGGALSGDDADVYRWNGASSYTRVVDGSTIGIPSALLGANSDIDGFVWVDASHFYMSFGEDTTISVPGPDPTFQDEDVVYYNAGTWSVYFDGTAKGLTGGNLDVDAFSLGAASSPPPPPPPPPAAFPATAGLDNFNRANSSNLGANWTSPSPGYRVNTNTLEIRGSAVTPELFTTGFGVNQEAYFTFNDVSALASAQGLVLKSSPTGDSMIRVSYRRSTGTVVVETVTGSVATQVGSFPATVVNGNTLGARFTAGVVTVYRNGGQVGTPINVAAWPGSASGGQIGLWFVGTTNTSNGYARIDNFGGGTLP